MKNYIVENVCKILNFKISRYIFISLPAINMSTIININKLYVIQLE